MRFVIQRVSSAKVEVEGSIVGQIDRGFLVLIGIGQGDDKVIADKLIRKLLGLRIFEDAEGKTNLSLADVNGSLLLVSQFTLYADCRKGNRPSFSNAALPSVAEDLYDYIVSECRKIIPDTATGSFGADMKISLVNDGPFTVILDSADFGDGVSGSFCRFA